jgi:excisionase family DNA binding protein
MLRERDDAVLTTQEACHYLRISRPTYLKYLYVGRIKGAKVGKGWKVLKSELDRFLKGGVDRQLNSSPGGPSSLLEERSSETH